MERAVALDLEGLKGPEIARGLGMKPKGLESLRARPEYTALLVEVGNELIRRMMRPCMSRASARSSEGCGKNSGVIYFFRLLQSNDLPLRKRRVMYMRIILRFRVFPEQQL
jgi:hypothetical protein